MRSRKTAVGRRSIAYRRSPSSPWRGVVYSNGRFRTQAVSARAIKSADVTLMVSRAQIRALHSIVAACNDSESTIALAFVLSTLSAELMRQATDA